MYSHRKFNIFFTKALDDFLGAKIKTMQEEILGKSDDYILNVNETDYINYLVDRYSVENLRLKVDEQSISTYEKEIPAELFPQTSLVRAGQRYRKVVITYHIPFEGDEELLHYEPNPTTLRTTEVSVEADCICFDVIDFEGDSESIKCNADKIVLGIKEQAGHAMNQVAAYNSQLLPLADRLFQERKQQLLNKSKFLAALGVPIRKRDDYPQTFAVPTPQTSKKIRVAQPTVTEKGYKPEPTLEMAVYQDILQIIHDVGRQFERMPSTYANKREEALRDHILLVLEPRFEGSATGETFNKTGKTDILLRYQGSNVFIAECKFWKGAKAFLDTITQLLGYLTWRDSKAAVVVFVENKDFSSVIASVESETPKHPNHLGFVDKKAETWLNYRFHLNADLNREVKLAVLLFHIPPV